MVSTAAGAAAQPWVALFDLDGTLTWRDTLVPFLLGFMRRHPQRLLRLWQLPFALYCYWRDRDRGALKSRVIRMVMGGASRQVLEAWAESFVSALQPKQKF